MAVDAVNKSGGVLGKQVKVLVEDDQGLPEQALTVVTKLITRDKVVAVLGEVASGNTLAAAPFAQKSGVPMISPSSTNVAVTQKGDYISRVCFIDPFQGFVMAKFAANTLKLKNVAVLRDLKTLTRWVWRMRLSKTSRRWVEALQPIKATPVEIRISARNSRRSNPKTRRRVCPGLLLRSRPDRPAIQEARIECSLMGGDGWDSPRLQEIGGDALNGSYFSNHYAADDPNPVIVKFVTEYRSRFNQTPDGLAALGYDAANVLFEAIRRANSTDGPMLRDAIAATKDFQGVTGKITINKDRNADKPAVVIEIKDGKFAYRETITP
jgi:branched-chain amino acid transport system substrate-binding protein